MAVYLGGNEVGFNTTHGGIVPSGTSTITENGIYDVTNFASASVSVASSGGLTIDEIAMTSYPSFIVGENASFIGNYAFIGLFALITVSFPSATSIGSSAFQRCYSLTTANFPNVTFIGTSAFQYCYSLTTANFPNAITIDNYAFDNCFALTDMSCSNATTISSYAFQSCSALITISFPSVETIGSEAFKGCSALTTTSFPNVTFIGTSAFQYCYSLTTLSFPKVRNIDSYAFRSCYNLLSLYLLGSSIPLLTSTNAFSSTPMSYYTTSTGGVYGSIFVPSSLYSSYLTATNWSRFSNRFVSV